MFAAHTAHDAIGTMMYNYPVPILFAGFKSDTVTLANNGWSISARISHSAYSATEMVTLALKYDTGSPNSNIYMLTNEIALNVGDQYTSYSHRYHDISKWASNFLKSVPAFSVQCINSKIHLVRIPVVDFKGYDEFQPIDARPQREEIYDLSQIGWFKPINPNIKDVLIVEEDIPMVLDMILNAQKNQQEKIQEKRKQRENLKKYNELKNGIYTAPHEEVKLQIVGVA